MTTEERLEKLERELIRLKGEEVVDKISARKISLVDERGESRAELSIIEDNPCLELYASKGDSCARLAVIGDDAGLTLFDKQGTVRVSLYVNGANTSLTMYDEKRKRIWSAP